MKRNTFSQKYIALVLASAALGFCANGAQAQVTLGCAASGSAIPEASQVSALATLGAVNNAAWEWATDPVGGPAVYPVPVYRPNGGGLTTWSTATIYAFGLGGIGGSVLDDRETFFKTTINFAADVDPVTFAFEATGAGDDLFLGMGIDGGATLATVPFFGQPVVTFPIKGFSAGSHILYASVLNYGASTYSTEELPNPLGLLLGVNAPTTTNSQCNKLTKIEGAVVAGTTSPITGTGDPGATITLSGVTCSNAPVIVDASGKWSCTPSAPIPATSLTATPTYAGGRTMTGAPMAGTPAQRMPASCTVSPSSTANGADPVTVNCTGIPAGTNTAVPGLTCAPMGVGTVSCTGTAAAVGSNPPVSFVDPSGNSVSTTLPFTLTPTCTPSLAAAPGGTVVTTTCTNVTNGMIIAVPGSTCTPSPFTGSASGTVTCTGAAAGLGANPPVTVTAQPGSPAAAGALPLLPPLPFTLVPTCSVSPAAAFGSTVVTTTCIDVPDGMIIAVPGSTCTPSPFTGAVSGTVTCTGTAAGLGNNPSITVTAQTGSPAAAVTLPILPPLPFTLISAPICTASPIAASGSTLVTTTCTNVTSGMIISIPGSTCTPSPFTGAGLGTVTCTGTAAGLGNNPPVTVTAALGSPAAASALPPVPPLVFSSLPPMSCSASPSSATGSTPVTVTCLNVPSGVALSLPGASCTPSPVPPPPTLSATVVCTGATAAALGTDPMVSASGGGLAAGFKLRAPFALNIPSLSHLGLVLLAALMGVMGWKMRKSSV